MTGGTLGNGADMSLNSHALDVVSRFGTRINGMGCAVTGLTLEAAVSFAETEQAGSIHGGIRICGKSHVRGVAL